MEYLAQPGRCRRSGRRRTRARPLHDRRIHGVHRSARRAGDRAALGHAERDRPRDRRPSVEGAARRVPAARREGYTEHRVDELRRRRGDGRRRRLRRRHGRREDPRLRESTRAACSGSISCPPAATPRRASTWSTAASTSSIAAGGGGKNATKSGDRSSRSRCPRRARRRTARRSPSRLDQSLRRRDARRLGPHERRAHFTVEDGAIVGRTVESSASMNSFLCTTREFGDFELELETMVDRVTNQGIQIRRRVARGDRPRLRELRRARLRPAGRGAALLQGLSATGMLYGEALGTGWLVVAGRRSRPAIGTSWTTAGTRCG